MKPAHAENPAGNVPTKLPSATEREKAISAAFAARVAENGVPRMVLKGEGSTIQLYFDHSDQGIAQRLVANSLGAASVTAGMSGIQDIVNVSATENEKPNADAANEALAIVKGIGPVDHVEMMLAIQMTAVHRATIDMSRRLNMAKGWPQIESAERAFNKLTRTFATQVEALKRYRSKGEQTVEVKHVHVHEGGQAIVGNVQQGGGKTINSDGTP